MAKGLMGTAGRHLSFKLLLRVSTGIPMSARGCGILPVGFAIPQVTGVQDV